MATPFESIAENPLANMAPNVSAEGQAHQANVRREEAGAFASVKASLTESSLASLYRWLKTPEYEPDANFDFAGRLSTVPYVLSQDELDFLKDNQAVSDTQFNDQMTRLTEYRANSVTMGDNPILSLITQVADPGWLGVSLLGGPASVLAHGAKIARTATGMRAAGAVGAGTASVGLGVVQTKDSPSYGAGSLLLDSVTNAIGGAFISRGGRRALDGQWPTPELERIRDNLPPDVKPVETPSWTQKLDAEGNPVLSTAGKPVYVQTRSPEVPDLSPMRSQEVQKVVQETALERPPVPLRTNTEPHVGASGRSYSSAPISEVMQRLVNSADPFVAQMAKYMQSKAGPVLDNLRVFRLTDADLAKSKGSSREHYNVEGHKVLIGETSDDVSLLHEVAHGAFAAKLNYGITNPNTTHGKLTREFNELRLLAKAQAEKINKLAGEGDSTRGYLTNNVQEFAVGLFSGDTNFLRMLSTMKAPAYRTNVLSAAFKTMRRLLGFSVSEESALAQVMKLTDDLLDLPISQKMLDTSGESWVKGGKPFGREVQGVALAAPPAAVQGIVQKQNKLAKQLGMKLGWNAHKTLAKWNKGVADLLIDDPTNMKGNSVESQRRAIRADLSAVQYTFEDSLLKAMANEGAGLRSRIFNQKEAMRIQKQVEKDVYIEMMARSDAERRGVPHRSQFPTHIQDVADKLGDVAEASLNEQKRAGVFGADAVDFNRNYVSRRWEPAKLSEAITKLQASGADAAQARNAIVRMVSGSVRTASGLDADTANDVAAALIDRALRKGDLSDTAFRGHVGNEAVAEVRDILKQQGLPPDRVNRALEVITGVVDEAGKAPSLKRRVNLDMSVGMTMPDGSRLMVYDLLDTDITRITDRYLDGAAARSAYATKGLRSTSDIAKVRQELIDSIPANNVVERQEAAKLFDNIVNFQNGRAAGEEVPQMMRMMADVTQMVALQSSGLWQVTEYATIMQRFGLGKTFGYFLKTMPGLRELSSTVKSREGATHLKEMLARQSSQDIRLRPFVNRLEDNFEIEASQTVQAVLTNSKQWVPYLNGMKYIHHHQAQMTANLIVDALGAASSGDARSVRLLSQYGLEGHTMDRIAKEIASKGHDVAKWDDEVWELARGPLTKMMDDAVLRARVGEVPAFAQFSALGKFMFTFRSFVLAAHNKLLAGTLARDHFAGLSLMLLYQYPLAMLAVQADLVYKGKGYEDDPVALSRKALLQSGSLGLITEPLGIIFGEKQQFGAPGFIALDRAMKLFGEAASGDVTGTVKEAANLIPILPLIPGIQAIRNNLE